MKKKIISMLVVMSSIAQASSKYDNYFKTMDEAKAIQSRLLNTPKNKVGPLMDLYICISTNVVTNKLSEKIQENFSNSIYNTLSTLSLGEKIIDALKKEDPNLFNLDLKQIHLSEACSSQLEIVNKNSKIPHNSIVEVVRLAEIGGMLLGLEMTSGID